jgi:hypothetical protein
MQAKIDAMEESHKKAMDDINARYTQQEKHLEKRKSEVLAHMRDEQRLEEEIASTKAAVLQRAIQHATANVASAAEGIEKACMDYLMDRGTAVKLMVDDFANYSEGDDYEILDDKINAFADAFAGMLYSATGAARCSKAENSAQLLDEAAKLAPAAAAFLQNYRKDGSEEDKSKKQQQMPDSAPGSSLSLGSATDGETSTDAPVQKVKALYPHEGKVQDNFHLIGFAKDDVMVLLKKREDGWSKVKLGDVAGWAPTSYLEELPLEAPTAGAEGAAGGDGAGAAAAVAESADPTAAISAEQLKTKVDTMLKVARAVQARNNQLATLANALVDDIGSKVSAAQQMIIDALGQIGKMREESKATDTDRLLEVNTNLMSVSETMLQNMQAMITAAEAMRSSLNSAKGMQTEEEFNTKHSSWFEGLTAAVDSVADGVLLQMEAMRSVIRRKGKHEELQVATRSIAASVAQLSALSKTKTMPRGDTTQENTSAKCDSVISVSHELLSASRECQALELASVMLSDLDNLTAHEAKKLQMDTQVNVLKLESELDREREKLGRLRRLNYDDK